MKTKSLLLICLAISLAIPMNVNAETDQKVTFYGNLRYSFNFIDDDMSSIDGFRGKRDRSYSITYSG